VTVPLTLLGLLDREPSHGYDLRWIDLTAASLDALAEVVRSWRRSFRPARTGSGWPSAAAWANHSGPGSDL